MTDNEQLEITPSRFSGGCFSSCRNAGFPAAVIVTRGPNLAAVLSIAPSLMRNPANTKYSDKKTAGEDHDISLRKIYTA